jgi:hypothetical protein
VAAAALVVFSAAGCQSARNAGIRPTAIITTTTSTAFADTSVTDPPTPTAADDQAFANQLPVQLAELPHGWIVQTGGSGGLVAGAFLACEASHLTFPSNGVQSTHSFIDPAGNTIVSAAAVFPFPSEVSLEFQDLQDGGTIPCLNQAWTSESKKYALSTPAGRRLTVGDTTFTALDFPVYAQGVMAFRGVVAYTFAGVSGTDTTDLIFVRHRRTVATFIFTGIRAPVAAAQEQHDVKLVADRMIASAQG